MKKRSFNLLREIFWYIILTGIFLFTPIRFIRVIALVFLLYRVLAALSVKLLPSKLELLLPEKPYYATLHKPFTLELEVRNKGFFPLPHFMIESRSRGLFFMDNSIQIISISGKSKRFLSFQLVGDSRGRHSWGPFTIKGTDPLRLFEWEYIVNLERTAIVYPTVTSMDLAISRGLTGGSLAVQNRIYENVTSFQALRKYQPGDELKRINWKASARLGELHSNIYDCSLYFPVQIVLNLSSDEYPLQGRSDLAERAIAAAASLSMHYLKLKQAVGFISSGYREDQPRGFRSIPGNNSPDQSSVILEELAGIQLAQEALSLKDLFKLPENYSPRGTKYLVISPPLLSEDLNEMQLQKQTGKDIELFYITGHRTQRKEISNPGLPFYVIHSGGGGRPVREY